MSDPGHRKYRGVFPPLVTPLREKDKLDEQGLECLISHLCQGGVDGLFILGTTGEAPSLSYQLRRDMIKHSCELAKGRLPVLVGITDTAFVESVTLARHAAECGAEAVVVAPPYYLPPAQTELLEYLTDLIAELPLPCMLYNMPPLTKVEIGMNVVKQLLDCEGIVGIKDSSGDLEYFHQIANMAHTAGDWSVLMGTGLLMLDSVLSGGDGGVPGCANLFPHFYSAAWQAAKQGDLERVQQMQETMLQIQQLLTVGRYSSSAIKGIKCSLEILNITGSQMAEPFRAFNEPEKQKIASLLEQLRQDPLLEADFSALHQGVF